MKQLKRLKVWVFRIGRDERCRKVESFGANRRQVRFKFVADKEGQQK